MRSRPALRAALGLALGVAGVVSYFPVVIHFGAWLPRVRNGAVTNWLVVVLGLALAVVALVRARRRLVPGLLVGLTAIVAGSFAAMLYVATALPVRAGPTVGTPAPDFALVDQSGTTVRLADFRGAPLLLVFYRGHW